MRIRDQTDELLSFPNRDLELNLSFFFVCVFFCRSSGGVVDAGPSYQKNMTEEISKLQRLYGGGDLTKFPDFTFTGWCRICSRVVL